MKKQLALGIAGASAALIGGWRLIHELVNRDEETDAVAVAPGMPAEAFTEESEPKAPATNTGPKASKSSSKAELYEVAQELDIDGRSKMTKDELLKAIQRAG